ncbi:MAG: metal ABC transporter ATP-binding protein [Candidatus Margulisiibacteriota bacterium]
MRHSCPHVSTHLTDISVRMGSQVVLERVNLEIHCGELLAVIGPNGAGKTTLLRVLLGDVGYEGQVRFVMEGSQRVKPRFGYVPQRWNVDELSPITVLDFMSMTASRFPIFFGVRPTIKVIVQEVLNRVSASHLIYKRLGNLSGGEMQRVLLAAALTPLPDILLLDEPVSGVDPDGLVLFYEIVNSLRKQKHVSIILVTHDLVGIAPHADRVLLIKQHVIAQGEPESVLSNEPLIRAFGPNLWNVAGLVDFGAIRKKKARK